MNDKPMQIYNIFVI